MGGLAAAAPEVLQGQDRASALLAHAKSLYEKKQIERALPLLRELITPGSPMEVTHAQRVEAYKYLGAAHALAGRRDSAITHFSTALAWDPFTDLDARSFTRAQIAVFVEARRGMFAVAIRPVSAERVDLRTDSVEFTAVTTHNARIRAELRSVSDPGKIVVWEGDNEGLRVLAWDGMDARGQLATPGRYRLSIVARSRILEWQDSTWVYFDLAHDIPQSAAEDDAGESQDTSTEPAAEKSSTGADAPAEGGGPQVKTQGGPGQVRATPPGLRQKGTGADVAKAFVIAGGALLVGGLLASDHLGGGHSEARIVAGLATVTAVVAALRGHRRRPEQPIPPPPPPRVQPRDPEQVVKRPPAPTAATPRREARERRSRDTRPVVIISPAAGPGS
jgi:hypothetical protein